MIWKRIWDRLAICLPVFLFALLLIRDWAALGVILSFFNGEGFIGYWIKHGVSFAGAVSIAIACSTFDIAAWFRLFFFVRDTFGHGKVIYDILSRQIDIDRLNGELDYLKMLKLWGLRLYLKFVPQPRRYRPLDAPYQPHARPYAWLLFYGFTPTCILPGVGYTVAFHLNPTRAFCIIASANAIKMIAFGYLAIHIPWQILAAIVVIGAPSIRRIIERQYAKRADR